MDDIKRRLTELLDDIDAATRARFQHGMAMLLRDLRAGLQGIIDDLGAPADEPTCAHCGAPESEQDAACGGDCPYCGACHGQCQAPLKPLAGPRMREDADVAF